MATSDWGHDDVLVVGVEVGGIFKLNEFVERGGSRIDVSKDIILWITSGDFGSHDFNHALEGFLRTHGFFEGSDFARAIEIKDWADAKHLAKVGFAAFETAIINKVIKTIYFLI